MVRKDTMANDATIGRSPSKRIAYPCLLLLLCHWGDAFSTQASHEVRTNPRKRRVLLRPAPNPIDEKWTMLREPRPLQVSSFAANDGDLSNLIPHNQETATSAKEQRILKDYRVPNVKDLLAFSMPAIFVWLCQPMLSMIDTSTVGLIAGTTQQAALMSAIAAINYSSRASAFLFSGTTTMIAAAQEGDRQDGSVEKARTARTLVGALQLSTLVGMGLGAFVFLFAHQLLSLIIGGGNSTPAIMGAAMKYVKIRALGFPAAAMLGSAQTACLAQRDIHMPLIATAVCALTNLFLDLILIRNPHAWVGGAAGAAWATTIAQYVAAGWSIRWLTSTKPRRQPKQPQSQQQESSGSFVSHSTKGFLAGRFSLRELVKRPAREISKGFSPYVIPVFTTQMGRSSASAAIDHVVSSSLSTASMAANQILTSVYYGLVPVAESLSLAAQNFVPSITEREGKAGEKSIAMMHLLKSFLKAAGLCGLFLAAIMGTLPLYCGGFTADATVRRLVTAVVPYIFVTCLKHGVFCTSEGILLGQKDLKFLGGQYGVYTFLIPYILLQVKKAALGGSTRVSLATVWQIFLAYDLFRTALMVGRIAWLERKRSRNKEDFFGQSTSG